MATASKIEPVLRLYPNDCQPRAIELVTSAVGFSGAKLWRVQTERGPLCLRRWPQDHPSPARLEFIQAVLWHVKQEGFHLIPIPIETRHQHGYLRHAGYLWELTPWLSGEAKYRQQPSMAKLRNALVSLAKFHVAAASFPLAETGPTPSPGIIERRDRLEALLGDRLALLCASITDHTWPELAARGHELLAMFAPLAPKLLPMLQVATRIRVPIQPCIRDIWYPHVLYTNDHVNGIVDFGSMRPDNVAGDVARLLGSLAIDDPNAWQAGLTAYQAVRRLKTEELSLVTAFDRSTVLMAGLQWLEWIYIEQRIFASREAVLSRVDEFLTRLATLSQTLG